MSEARIVKFGEDGYDEAMLFMLRPYLLGDKNGKWLVVSDDLVLGRYDDKERAQEHVNSLNAPVDPNNPFANMTTEELIEAVDKITKDEL